MRSTRWDDGLLDVFLGAALLMVGLVWLVPPISRFGGLAPLVLLPLWPVARAAVAAHASPGTAASARSPAGAVARRALVLLAIAAAVGFGMYRVVTRASDLPADWIGAVIPAFLGVLIGVGTVSLGLLLGLGRLLAYGVAVALMSAVMTGAGAHAGAFLALSGALVAACGWLILVRHLGRAATAEETPR